MIIDFILKAYFWLMVSVLAIGGLAAMENGYQRHADAIWCKQGDHLIYRVTRDAKGKFQKSHECAEKREPDQIWEKIDGRIVRLK